MTVGASIENIRPTQLGEASFWETLSSSSVLIRAAIEGALASGEKILGKSTPLLRGREEGATMTVN